MFIIDWSSNILVIQAAKHLTDSKSKIHDLKILRKVELYLW